MKNSFLKRIQQFGSLIFRISKVRVSIKVFATATVKGGHSLRRMVQLLRLSIYAVGGPMTPRRFWVTWDFCKALHQLAKQQGLPGVVKYLKVCSVCMQQMLAGYVLDDLTPLGPRVARSGGGIPSIIPRDQRILIRKRDVLVIKQWLTLFSIYRDISYKGKFNVSTIVKPSTATSSANEVGSMISSFTYLLWKRTPKQFTQSRGLFQIVRSAPQSSLGKFSTSPIVVLQSLAVLKYIRSDLLDSLMWLANHMGLSHITWLVELLTSRFSLTQINRIPRKHDYLGALGIKEEAAGKVRVFAMVDCWTQWVLQPFHKLLFKALDPLPMDGTFNQLAPLKRVPFGKCPIYSFDLSAATDRLPLWIQRDIVAASFGTEFAHHWVKLLVDRDYRLPNGKSHPNVIFPPGLPESVRYTVGQPMGALSSWAMLAITHHYLVQYSAWCAGVTPKTRWFQDYAVLGDDVVIWNAATAKVYLRVMKALGVEVGLAKSIISLEGKGLEFAKRTLLDKGDVSPIPFRDQEAARRTLSEMIQFAMRNNLTALQTLRFLGYGYRVDPTKNNKIVRALTLALSIPRDEKALIKAFLKVPSYMDIASLLEMPMADRERLLVRFIDKELDRLMARTSIYYDWVHRFTAIQVDGSMPRRSEQIVRLEILRSNVPDIIRQLEWLRKEVLFAKDNIRPIVELYNSFAYDIPHHNTNRLTPLSGDFQSAIRVIFKAERILDSHQLTRTLNPSKVESLSPMEEERRSTLRLWAKWSRLLSRIPQTSDGTKI